MRSRRCIIAFALAVAAPGGAAKAQELPDGGRTAGAASETEIIVSALKAGDRFGERSGIPLSEVPQSIQVIDAQELRERSARTIGDALRAVPSAGPGNPRGTPFQSNTIRGFAADQMRNGVRQRLYEAVDPGSLINVERIEVLKGPSAVLFGQSAVGGIVSIITKRPQKDWAGEARFTLGSFAQKVASLDLTGPLLADGVLGLRVTGEIERSETATDFVPLERENFALTLAGEPAEGLAGHLVFEWTARRTVGHNGHPPIGTVLPNGIAPIPRHRFLNEPDWAFLELEAPLVQAWLEIALDEGWRLTPRLSWNGYDAALARTGLRNLLPDLRTVNRFAGAQTNEGSFLIGQLDFAGDITTGGIAHDLLVGVEWADEHVELAQYRPLAVPPIDVLTPVYGRMTGPPWPLANSSRSDLESIAIYAQDLVEVTNELRLVLGARFSRFDTRTRSNLAADEEKFESFVWQAGATSEIAPALSLFGGLNTGFNVDPIVGGRSADGTPFEPERSRQSEIGIRYTGQALLGAISLFRLTRDNVLTPDPANAFFSIQTGRVRTEGVEIEARWRVAGGWSVDGGYAFIASRIVSSNAGDEGDSIARIPPHRANIFVTWNPPTIAGLSLRAGASLVGARRFSNSRERLSPTVFASDVELPSFAVAQFGLAWRSGLFEVDASLTNALDARYHVATGEAFAVYPGEPRFASVAVSARF